MPGAAPQPSWLTPSQVRVQKLTRRYLQTLHDFKPAEEPGRPNSLLRLADAVALITVQKITHASVALDKLGDILRGAAVAEMGTPVQNASRSDLE
jgi:hypothetical protein